jgi:preprotein translocase subunit SecY
VLSWLMNLGRMPELRRRPLFTAGVLAVYRFGSWLLLIAAGVALDTVRQMESQMTLRRHEGFLKS